MERPLQLPPGIPTVAVEMSPPQAMLSVSAGQRVDSLGGCGSLSAQLDHTGSRGWERSSAAGTCAVSALQCPVLSLNMMTCSGLPSK